MFRSLCQKIQTLSILFLQNFFPLICIAVRFQFLRAKALLLTLKWFSSRKFQLKKPQLITNLTVRCLKTFRRQTSLQIEVARLCKLVLIDFRWLAKNFRIQWNRVFCRLSSSRVVFLRWIVYHFSFMLSTEKTEKVEFARF